MIPVELFVFRDAFCAGDGAGGAHQAAQMAAHAFLAVDVWQAGLVDGDGLVAAVLARDKAAAATYALLAINHRKHHCRAVEVGRTHKRGQLLAHEVLHTGHAAAAARVTAARRISPATRSASLTTPPRATSTAMAWLTAST